MTGDGGEGARRVYVRVIVVWVAVLAGLYLFQELFT